MSTGCHSTTTPVTWLKKIITIIASVNNCIPLRNENHAQVTRRIFPFAVFSFSVRSREQYGWHATLQECKISYYTLVQSESCEPDPRKSLPIYEGLAELRDCLGGAAKRPLHCYVVYSVYGDDYSSHRSLFCFLKLKLLHNHTEFTVAPCTHIMLTTY